MEKEGGASEGGWDRVSVGDVLALLIAGASGCEDAKARTRRIEKREKREGRRGVASW